jgi:hypothetical protein
MPIESTSVTIVAFSCKGEELEEILDPRAYQHHPLAELAWFEASNRGRKHAPFYGESKPGQSRDGE